MATEARSQTGKRIDVRVLTTQGLAVSDEAVSVRVPGKVGSFGVLHNHAPLVSTLSPGVLRWRHADGTERFFAIGEGIAEVAHNKVTVLTSAVREVASPPPSAAHV